MQEDNKDNKLFVYGIFLEEYQRKAYNMRNPHYAVVLDYTTVHLGHGITGAIKVEREGSSLGLTGMIVDVEGSWHDLDRLEAGYKRERVETTDGDECYMYVL